MASIKAIAAIALTLMIAVPIIMGYGFASTEQTNEYWQTDSTANATDLLLNTETDYYMDYTDPNNNAMIYQKYVAQGGTSYGIVAPDYSSVTSNYSSLPEYTDGTQSVSLTSGTTNTYNGAGGSSVSWGDSTSGADHLIGNHAGIYITVDTSAPTPVHWTIAFNGSTYHSISGLSTTFYVDLVRDSGSTWTAFVTDHGTVTAYNNVEDWKITTDVDYDVEIYTRGYTTIGISGSMSFSAPAYSTVVLTESDDTKHYIPCESTTAVTRLASGFASVGSETYNDIGTVAIVAPKGYSTLSVTYSTASGNYADPAHGWAIPVPTGVNAHYSWWTNGQDNEEVRLYVKFSAADSVYLGPCNSAVTSQLAEIVYNGTGIYVRDVAESTTEYLGAYSSALVVIKGTEATVYGLASWPTMGTTASTFNSVTVDYTDAGDTFTYISLSDSYNGNVLYRVDYANIVAGTFPSTKDLWLYLSDSYPQTSVEFTVRSIAVYGESFGFGSYGGVYNVTDGKITFTDTDGEQHTSAVRGMTVRMIYDENADNYSVSVNGHQVDDAGFSGVWFGGEWSVTASVALISEQTSTQQVWAPGEFAFEKEDFAACGLLVAGMCLVGLGMTGPRSGIKMGVLLMICGGAALVYLTLI